MKILTAEQIRELERYTIKNEGIDFINLMERAAEAISQWICNNVEQQQPICFFIGKGNNGGDGLAVARMLFHAGFDCSVLLLYPAKQMSDDAQYNLKKLPKGISVRKIYEDATIDISSDSVVVDAILGSGVKGKEDSYVGSIIEHINSLPCRIISIDMPSGMLCEFGNRERTIVHADVTLALELPKLSQLLPEAGDNCGELVVLPIDLDREYLGSMSSYFHYITEDTVKHLFKKRRKFAHKGDFGHALIVCGCDTMMGASLLATGAALRSGCGLVTSHVPINEKLAVQVSHPSAILSLDISDNCFSSVPVNLNIYNVIGVGCGIGKEDKTIKALGELLKSATCPLILDADALNILASNKDMLNNVPAGSVLTPHLGELRRLLGEWDDQADKISRVQKLSGKLKSIIIVKGAHSMICMPDGDIYINSTGISAMAKGGSGDVLTGLLTGLVARGYSVAQASVLGVYIHGLAGEKCAEYYGVESMNSSDMIDFLAEAMRTE